jgi:hypothetical protein
MQAPATFNMSCYQGATFGYTFTWTVTSGTVTTPVDLTNYSARMQVRRTYDSTAIALGLTSGSGISLGGTAGTIILEADPSTTAAIASGQYVYDLEMVTGAGAVTRLVEGNFIVDPEVTR